MVLQRSRVKGRSSSAILAIMFSLGGAMSACSSDTRVPAGTGPTAGSGSGGTGPTAGSGSGGTSAPAFVEQGVSLRLNGNATAQAEKDRLDAKLAEVDGLDAAAFKTRYGAEFEPAPSYDDTDILGLDLIQASSLRLSQTQLAALTSRGFAISQQSAFPTFAYGYATIYMEDLPVYVSADSILNAVHESYDDILKYLEVEALSPQLGWLLAGMHDRLAAGVGRELGAGAVEDADVFLTVARSLLLGSAQKTRAGGDQAAVSALVQKAQAASGIADVSLFGVTRKNEDFSQFKPRGHYTDSAALENYFRAMIWLGRIDLRLLETQMDGSQLFRRGQANAMFLLRELIDSDLRANFDAVDATISAFVGEADYMTLPQVDALARDLGVTRLAQLPAVSDERLAQTIVDGGYGEQRISSHIVFHGARAPKTLPLSRSFALLGQRYVIDSHVFSNVVYDRVGKRMMPSPLDVAFAALGNDQAAALLAPELERHQEAGYPGALAKMRTLAEEHPPEYWNGTLYTRWLSALRTLAPANTSLGEDATSLFPAARSEAWGRRLLSTQLASWAELRHDTILYVKQSYTTGAACEFPDAYVDPYPAFYSAIADYGRRGSELTAQLAQNVSLAEKLTLVASHFALVTEVAETLRGMAEHERTGNPFTAEMLAFINDAIMLQPNCDQQGGILEAGWYKRLFFDPSSATERNPIVADVHTQPTDEGGNVVGNVLHVGTGTPRTMVVVAETCSGPRAYAGLVSSYYETLTSDFERLTDADWGDLVTTRDDVPWMQDLLSSPSDD